jgi:glycosyltransferase involved in cell wall biosynthesis
MPSLAMMDGKLLTKMTQRAIKIFTETSADAHNINAQSLTVREVVSRLDPLRFRVAMTHLSEVDPRILQRPNTRLVRGSKRGKTAKYLCALFAFRPDIYFYPQPSPMNAIFLAARRRLGLKVKMIMPVVTSFSLGKGIRRDWFGGASLLRAIREADVVVGNSRFVSNDVEKVFGVRAITIHNGVDRRNFFPLVTSKPAGQAVTVLYAGSFRPYKRPKMVIEAARMFPNSKFIMVGEGEEKKACEELARSLPARNVDIVGAKSPEELGHIMRQADIFFFPSVVEGHPQVLGQAAACGLPCAAMNCYSPDSVINGKTGFLAVNDEEIYQHLGLLIENPKLRRQFGDAAVEHVKQFDWDQIVREWASLFESIVTSEDNS